MLATVLLLPAGAQADVRLPGRYTVPAPPAPLVRVETRDAAVGCMAEAIYYEAGAESLTGQQAVAQVVLNRMNHPAYPKTVCGVVYQGAERRTGCQFTFTCDGSLLRPHARREWAVALDVARQAVDGALPETIGTATHYHADYVSPRWAPTLVRIGAIGAHIFYRMPGPSEARTSPFVVRTAGFKLSRRQARAAADASREFRPWGLMPVISPGGTES